MENKKVEYGEDFVGWLSYVFHKKETMEYIQSLEEKIQECNEQVGLMNIKLKDKQRTIRELKKGQKKE